jgi:hypothetical protein
VIIFRKAAFSLLISTLLFAVFTALAFTGLFDLVEARFYNPAVVRAISREIDADAEVVEEFFEELQIRFAATLKEGAVRRSLLADMESEDIVLRAGLYGELLESLGGLQSVRFIDSGGRRIHFSTWPPDILRQDRNSIAYRNYGAEENSAAYIPYGQVEAEAPKLILDGAGERIVFSHPFYDSFDIYRGTALFSLSVRAVMDRMVIAGRIKVGEDISVVSEPPGLVVGLPAVGRNVLLPLIAGMWRENSLSLGRLNSDLTGVNLALISRKTDQGLHIGRLVNESLLSFPLAMRIILLISFFITVCLIIFLLFNFRQDDLTIIQSRLKKLQVNLLEEYYEHAGNLNWNRWKRELEHRREDVHSELKRGLSAKIGAGGLAEIDNFIDRSWDDLMAIIGGNIERQSGIDEDALRTLLGRLLPEAAVAAPHKALVEAEPGDSEEIEALDEADIVEALEGPAEVKISPEAPEPEAELEELEAADMELAELELVDPEELEAVDEPEPDEPGGEAVVGEPEAADPIGAAAGLAEREAAEAEPGEPGGEAAAGEPAAAGPIGAAAELAGRGAAEPEPEEPGAEAVASEPEAAGPIGAAAGLAGRGAAEPEPDEPGGEAVEGEPEAAEPIGAAAGLAERGAVEPEPDEPGGEATAGEPEAAEPIGAAAELAERGAAEAEPGEPSAEAVAGEPVAAEPIGAAAGLAEREAAEAEPGEPGGEAVAGEPEAAAGLAGRGAAEAEPDEPSGEAVAGEPEAAEPIGAAAGLAEREAAEAEPDEPGGEAVAGEPAAAGPIGAAAGLAERGAAEPEPGEPGGEAVAGEPELEELEAAEPEFGRPGMTTFHRVTLPEFEDSDETEAAMDNLVRAIEFSPDSQELEQEKERAAKSMAEHFKIQSPFASIFSTLSEVEFEPEPMEDLESLEREWLAPDDFPETEAEELRFGFAGPQLSVPFLKALNGEITLLAVEDEDKDMPAAPEEAADGEIITERDGVNYINESVLRPDKETLKGLDKNFKNLIDSILNNT